MKLLQLFFAVASIICVGVMGLPVNYSAVGISNTGYINQDTTRGNSIIRNVSNTGYLNQRGTNGNSVIYNVENNGYINQRKPYGDSVIHDVQNNGYINQRKNINGKPNVISNRVNNGVINH